MFEMASSDRAKDGEITSIRSSECLPQSLLWQDGFHCTMFMFRSQSRKRVLFCGYEYILHPLVDPFAQLYAHNTPFYTFNKDNIEHLTQVK